MFQIPMFSFRQKNVKIEQAKKEILKSKYTIPKQKFLLNILSSSQKIVPYHHELCLPVLEIHINGIRRNAIFCVRLPFTKHNISEIQPCIYCKAHVSLLSSIHVCEYIIFCFSTFQRMNTLC